MYKWVRDSGGNPSSSDPPGSSTLRAIAWVDIVPQGDVIWLHQTATVNAVAAGHVWTNQDTKVRVWALHDNVVYRLRELSLRDNDVAVLFAEWKVIRTFIPLQIRLFMEQAFYDAGQPWAQLFTGFKPVAEPTPNGPPTGGPSNGQKRGEGFKAGDQYPPGDPQHRGKRRGGGGSGGRHR